MSEIPLLDVSTEDDEVEIYISEDSAIEKTHLLNNGPHNTSTFTSNDASSKQEKNLPYPKSVFFIIGNEFCERFSFYGMRAILTLYMRDVLKYSEDSSTVLFHSWTMLCYFTPIMGAMLADSLLGRYRTILYISIIYLCGNSVLSFSAIPPLFNNLTARIAVSCTGLVFIAVGTGGIKPCVSAFGGDQFILPQQERQLSQFFSVFYFSINAGSLLSTFITPILREDVSCFNDDCYSLAFGVPALLMFFAMFLFVAGSSKYIQKPPEGNIVISVIKCVLYSLKKKVSSGEKLDHWLDHGRSHYDDQLIQDIKDLFKVLLLYLPLPFFWALYDQQGSRWTFQATRMNGDVGHFTIKPDQLQAINPLMVLLMIPLFDRIIYPQLSKCGLLTKPLQKMVVGGFCTAAAFIVSGIVETQLELEGSTKNKVHMLWLIPQYCLISIGEVMFSITGLEFSFTQAPGSMKSVLQACWLSTISMGNLIVVIVAHSDYFEKKSLEFFLFAGLMVIDMVIFIILSWRYKYVNEGHSINDMTPLETDFERDASD